MSANKIPVILITASTRGLLIQFVIDSLALRVDNDCSPCS